MQLAWAWYGMVSWPNGQKAYPKLSKHIQTIQFEADYLFVIQLNSSAAHVLVCLGVASHAYYIAYYIAYRLLYCLLPISLG